MQFLFYLAASVALAARATAEADLPPCTVPDERRCPAIAAPGCWSTDLAYALNDGDALAYKCPNRCGLCGTFDGEKRGTLMKAGGCSGGVKPGKVCRILEGSPFEDFKVDGLQPIGVSISTVESAAACATACEGFGVNYGLAVTMNSLCCNWDKTNGECRAVPDGVLVEPSVAEARFEATLCESQLASISNGFATNGAGGSGTASTSAPAVGKACKAHTKCAPDEFCRKAGKVCDACADCTPETAYKGECPNKCAKFIAAVTATASIAPSTTTATTTKATTTKATTTTVATKAASPCRTHGKCGADEFCGKSPVGKVCAPCADCTKKTALKKKCPSKCDAALGITSGKSCKAHGKCGADEFCTNGKTCAPCAECSKSMALKRKCPSKCDAAETSPASNCRLHSNCDDSQFCNMNSVCASCADCTLLTSRNGKCPSKCI